MRCSACKNGDLVPAYIEGLFPCHTCDNCGGSLVMMGDYLRWQDQNADIDLNSEPPLEVEAQETSKAMICPKTGGIMTKYLIAKDSDHRLDFSPSINAIWLDKGEWAILKEKGLAGRLNNIFTDHWQHEIRSQASADVLDSLYQKKFGEHYQALIAFRELLENLDNRSEAIAFLLSDDPYRV